MHLYLVRHPAPLGSTGRCYGRLELPVLAADVARTATEVRSQIPDALWRAALIYTSPLARCADLARELAAPGAPIVVDALLEMDFGAWQGQLWERVPRTELDAWARDLWSYRPGGGENARAVADRWRRWVRELRVQAPAVVIAVTHAGVIRVARALTRIDADAVALASHIGFGSVHCVDLPAELV